MVDNSDMADDRVLVIDQGDLPSLVALTIEAKPDRAVLLAPPPASEEIPTPADLRATAGREGLGGDV